MPMSLHQKFLTHVGLSSISGHGLYPLDARMGIRVCPPPIYQGDPPKELGNPPKEEIQEDARTQEKYLTVQTTQPSPMTSNPSRMDAEPGLLHRCRRAGYTDQGPMIVHRINRDRNGQIHSIWYHRPTLILRDAISRISPRQTDSPNCLPSRKATWFLINVRTR